MIWVAPPSRTLARDMTYPHRIRLRGPWEFRPADSVVDNSAPDGNAVADWRPVSLPGDWRTVVAAVDTPGWMLRRYFSRPTNLEVHERVWLVCRGVPRPTEVTFNGVVLLPGATPAAPHRCDLTERLKARNELLLRGAGAPAESKAAEFELQITGSLAVDELVAVWTDVGAERRLTISGQLQCEPPARRIELIARAAGREAARSPLPSEGEFHVAVDTAAAASADSLEICVLVDGRVLWNEQIGCTPIAAS